MDVCNKVELYLLISVAELRAAIDEYVTKVWNDHEDGRSGSICLTIYEQKLLLKEPTLLSTKFL